jgi:DNA-binding XRE family transcriptional regulator
MPTGTALKLELVRRGHTTQWLSEQIEVERTTVSRWVNGTRTPKVGDAQKIARALETTVEELWPESVAA